MADAIDLRAERSARIQTAAFYAVKDLAKGAVLVLVTAHDPSLMMASISLQLRDVIAWTSTRTADGWRTEVRHREEAPPTGLVDVLTRDHRRLDELLATALRRVNAGDLKGAQPLVAELAIGLRRHIQVENDLLAPVLPHPAGADGAGHVEIMRREHDEIMRQLAEVEALFGAESLEPWEVEPFIAILSGTLAKHEYREESNLFPAWDAALAHLANDGRADLERRASAVLAP